MGETAQEFYEDHGYQRGSQSAIARSMGIPIDKIMAGGRYGKNLNPRELKKVIAKYGNPMEERRAGALENLQTAADMNYQFDPQKFLPGIKQQSESIYSPQQSQLQAIRLLQASQAQEQRVTTEEQFDKQLRSEVESINRRGAYFGGGAIEREQEIGDVKMRALQQLDLSASVADFSNLAQQGLLAAEESQFIQDRLYNAESSAYGRWTDQRNFSFMAASKQYELYADERNYLRNTFEADRTYSFSVRQAEVQREQFEKQYSLTKQEFSMAKEKFGLDMKKSQLSYDQALRSFKQGFAITNSGLLGVDEGNNDVLDSYRQDYELFYGTSSNHSPSYDMHGQGISTQYDGGIFSIDSFLNQ